MWCQTVSAMQGALNLVIVVPTIAMYVELTQPRFHTFVMGSVDNNQRVVAGAMPNGLSLVNLVMAGKMFVKQAVMGTVEAKQIVVACVRTHAWPMVIVVMTIQVSVV